MTERKERGVRVRYVEGMNWRIFAEMLVYSDRQIEDLQNLLNGKQKIIVLNMEK